MTSVKIKFFRTVGYTIFYQRRNEEILGELKVEPVEGNVRRYKIELFTICNKNEQQQVAKCNAELQTKWTKTTRPKQLYEGLTCDW